MQKPKLFILTVVLLALGVGVLAGLTLLMIEQSTPVQAASHADWNAPGSADIEKLQVATEVFTVGVLGPFSGPNSQYGDELKRAVTMAFETVSWQVGPYEIKHGYHNASQRRPGCPDRNSQV